MFSLKETDRNNLSNKSTGLSKDLASGKKDPREVLRYINSLTPKTPGEKKYLDEIKRQVIFREFANSSIQQQTYRIPPGSKPATDPAFIALKKGETGIPIIDAAVNEMKSTGEPHNRARLLLARYAIRNLNVDPEEVAKWFAESFQDYDPILTTFNVSQAASATNFGEPYYRKSNPLTAQKALDPTGAYVSTWLPADYKGKTKDEIQKEISQGHDYWTQRWKSAKPLSSIQARKLYPTRDQPKGVYFINSQIPARGSFAPYYKTYMREEPYLLKTAFYIKVLTNNK